MIRRVLGAGMRRHVSAFMLVGVLAVAMPSATAAPRLPATPIVPLASKPNVAAPIRPTTLVTASWYGSRHHGRRTANGEVFDATAFTAAHRTLPFGTRLVATNPQNGKTVTVRVNDRGPYVKGRALDLSEAAARVIGMHAKGTAKVMIIRAEK